eukprot:scaffold18661_cov56-Isochrysis_galbana.AAC.1
MGLGEGDLLSGEVPGDTLFRPLSPTALAPRNRYPPLKPTLHPNPPSPHLSTTAFNPVAYAQPLHLW